MLVLEYQRFDHTYSGGVVADDAISQGILFLANSWDFSWQQKTHTAQLTRHLLSVINKFQAYVNWKIKLLGVQPANMYNADQTNVFYLMESTYTLSEWDSKTVLVKGAES
jgi:hypothetical protein